MRPVITNHHCPQRDGQIREGFPRGRHRSGACLLALSVQNSNHEVGAADFFDLF
jgi:hypothetical protein